MAEFDDSISFEKQRRNLILYSAALLLLMRADVKFEKLSLAGFEARIDHPQVLTLFLGVFWLYFLCRYYQCPSARREFATRRLIEFRNAALLDALMRVGLVDAACNVVHEVRRADGGARAIEVMTDSVAGRERSIRDRRTVHLAAAGYRRVMRAARWRFLRDTHYLLEFGFPYAIALLVPISAALIWSSRHGPELWRWLVG